MRQSLRMVAAGVSLLLFVTMVGLWARSLGHHASTIWLRPERYVEVENVDGVLGLEWARDSWSRPPIAGGALYGRYAWRSPLPAGRDRTSLRTPTFNRFGFGFHVVKTIGPPQGMWRYGNRSLVICYVPYWLLALLFAVLPGRWLMLSLRQGNRNQSGHCASCGYNLTGNTSGVCPECGATASKARARRQRTIKRAKLAAALVLVAVLAPVIGHTALEEHRDHQARKQTFACQERLMNSTDGPDVITYAEDTGVSQKLLASDPHYVPIGRGACYVQDALRDVDRVPGVYFGNGPPTLFVHGLRSPDGTRMLVTVPLMALEDAEDLRADVFVAATDDEPGLYRRSESQLVLRRWPDEHITFMAGQPDPADASHFTIRYRIGDRTGTIDGWLTNGATVRMQVRDGPAEMLSASATPRPTTWKWGGRPTTRKYSN